MELDIFDTKLSHDGKCFSLKFAFPAGALRVCLGARRGWNWVIQMLDDPYHSSIYLKWGTIANGPSESFHWKHLSKFSGFRVVCVCFRRQSFLLNTHSKFEFPVEEASSTGRVRLGGRFADPVVRCFCIQMASSVRPPPSWIWKWSGRKFEEESPINWNWKRVFDEMPKIIFFCQKAETDEQSPDCQAQRDSLSTREARKKCASLFTMQP